jgi:cytidylate kinase
VALIVLLINAQNSSKGDSAMSIITISRGSYSKGKTVAEKVAAKLGYECLARDAIIEASKEFNIPEIKLVRAIHDAPTILERFNYSKEKYLAYLQVTMLEHFQKDNIVYHGLGGHFFVKNISHVLKVRIIADMEDRIKLEMERTGISREEALRILRNDDNERCRWSKYLYGIDTCNPSPYDLVIHIRKITADDAADIICQAVGLKQFKTTPESQKALDRLLVAARVKVALIDVRPDVQVYAKDGTIVIRTKGSGLEEKGLAQKIKAIAAGVPGVKDVDIDFEPYIFADPE